MIKAAGIMYICGNSVLLLKRRETEYNGHTWAFPGGKLEEGETPVDAAVRESREEIGNAPSGPLMQLDFTRNEYVEFTTFICPVDKFRPHINEEHSEFQWADLNALPEPLHPGVAQTLAKHKEKHMPAGKEVKENASQFPRMFYCRHMQPGICGYENEIVLVDTDALKAMLPTGVGKPVFIHHQDVELDTMKEKAAGWITEAFYNELDGWGWFKFLAIDDACFNAIRKGWSVSNAYLPSGFGDGGTKNNCPYQREVLNADFTHLAIVPVPRYENAKIFTPEEFKAHQDSKKAELEEMRNSKPSKGKPMFKLFKNTRQEVAQADADTSIELEGGQTVTVGEMINALTNAKEKKCDDQMVNVAGEEMPLKELVNKYNTMMKKNKKENESDKDDDKDEGKAKDKDEKKNKKVKKNTDSEDDADSDDGRSKKQKPADESGHEDQVEEDADEDEKENSKDKDHFNELRNAHLKATQEEAVLIETNDDKLARGKSRYSFSK